jgi:hypothetical protein
MPPFIELTLSEADPQRDRKIMVALDSITSVMPAVPPGAGTIVRLQGEHPSAPWVFRTSHTAIMPSPQTHHVIEEYEVVRYLMRRSGEAGGIWSIRDYEKFLASFTAGTAGSVPSSKPIEKKSAT